MSNGIAGDRPAGVDPTADGGSPPAATTAARAGGTRLSVVTRNALAVGLAAIRSTDGDRDPPPASPGATAMRAAA